MAKKRGGGTRGGKRPAGRKLGRGRKTERQARDELYDRIIDTSYPSEAKYVTLREQLDEIPLSDLEGLERITFEAPTDYRRQSFWFQPVGTRRKVAGVYRRDEKTVYLHPTSLYGFDANRSTLVHEVGHHVSYKKWLGREGDFPDRVYAALDNPTNFAKVKDLGKVALARMGLTTYGQNSAGEFLAQSYECWRLGTKEQWTQLSSFVDETIGPTGPKARSFSTYFGKSR